MAVPFEVEAIVDIKERGVFVFARALEPEVDFSVPRGSTLGGVALENFLDMPRALDETGNQRMDYFAFQLKAGRTGEGLTKGATVELRPGNQLEYLVPWHPSTADAASELHRELGPEHVLFGAQVRTLAHRQDCDDVLFALEGDRSGFAVVHLTYSSKPEMNPTWPETRLFKTWPEVYEQVIFEDNQDWQ